MLGTCAGAQVISTVQARVDGAIPSTRSPFSTGSMFRWSGTPLRLDGARAAFLLSGAEGYGRLRDHAPNAVAKLGRGRGISVQPQRIADPRDDPDALIVESGDMRWSAQLVTAGSETLLVFHEGLPPANTELRIAQAPAPHEVTAPHKTICFTPGSLIPTPDGRRAVEDLYPGDQVLTRDDGAQEILWMGLRRVSGARMFAMPGLRPILIRAGALGAEHGDLLVSPDHQVLLSGRKARALWGEDEVLVQARDLVDDRAVTLDHRATEVTYLHILFKRHQVIEANGLPTESFHPAGADLSCLNTVERDDLLELVPDADTDAGAYGPQARRCLSAAELAILRHEGAPRYLS